MRALTITTIAMLISANAIADTATSSGFSKTPSPLNALGHAFNAPSSVAPKIQNDMTMGYAGEDVSRKLTISSPTTAL